MAGYSGTPLPRKLGIKPGHRVALIGAPAGFSGTLGELPDGVAFVTPGETSLDVALLFAGDMATLVSSFDVVAASLAPAGGLWVCWPKKASGVPTDLTENIIRNLGLERGLVDNKVCAIDETWSGLRFVRRLKDRPGNR